MNQKILHGGDVYRNKVQYDFSVSVNLLGMPDCAVKAAKAAVELCGRYPDIKGGRLCQAIVAAKGISEDAIVLGNGAAELIYALCFALRPKKALTVAPTFQEYEMAVRASGGTLETYHLCEETGFAVDDGLLDCITEDIDLMFLCNPNNPTGRLVDDGLLRKIEKRCEENGVILCLDECFLPFVRGEEQKTRLAGRCPKHVVVLRAFTKIYAMAGLRLGYMLVADETLREKISGVIQPWNTSIPAQAAGAAAFADTEYIDRTKAITETERTYLAKRLETCAQKVYYSDANFLLVRAEEDVGAWLLAHGILVRDCGSFEGLCKGYYRIAVRTRAENDVLLARWREKYKGHALK